MFLFSSCLFSCFKGSLDLTPHFLASFLSSRARQSVLALLRLVTDRLRQRRPPPPRCGAYTAAPPATRVSRTVTLSATTARAQTRHAALLSNTISSNRRMDEHVHVSVHSSPGAVRLDFPSQIEPNRTSSPNLNAASSIDCHFLTAARACQVERNGKT